MGRGMGALSMVVAVFVGLMGFAGVEAQVHHIVGGDRGWHPISDVESWSATREFRVGDNLWFTYAAADESISELRTKEEFESCDVSNPIRLYSDGVYRVNLEREGIRYFTSSLAERCAAGLKVHVEVQPIGGKVKVAEGPTPSGSVALQGFSSLLVLGLGLVFYVGF